MTVPRIGGEREVVVRPAERADLLDVFRIEKASFPQPWPYSAFERFLDDPGFFVAAGGADGTDVVGYAVQDVTPNHGRDIGHLKDLAVRPDDRGQGVGRRLLGRSLAWMRDAGATVAKLEVRESNDPALALYHDAGFEAARRLPRYYQDGEDAILMRRDLRTV